MAYSEKEMNDSFDSIIEKIESGKSLRQILTEDNTPSSQTFFKWIDLDDVKSKRYARACEVRADLIFEEILSIADNVQEGVVVKETENGVEKTTADMIAHRRLQVDARKWMLGKMNPKKYGDKNTTVLEGGDVPIKISFLEDGIDN